MSILTATFDVPKGVPCHLANLYKDTLRQINSAPHGKELVSILLDPDTHTWAGYEDTFQIYLLSRLISSKASNRVKTLFVKAFALQTDIYEKFIFDGEPIVFNQRPERWKQHFYALTTYLQERDEGEIPVWGGPSYTPPWHPS